MKSMRKCILCPSTHLYSYCSKCRPGDSIEPWRFSFDTENCRDIYNILAEFAFGRKTALDARKELDKYQLPNKEELSSPLRKNLEDIYAQSDAIFEVEERQTEETMAADVVPDNDVLLSNYEDIVVEPKPRQRRSRRSYSE